MASSKPAGWIAIVLTVVGMLASLPARAAPTFSDEAAAAGLVYDQHGVAPGGPLTEMLWMTGGAAAGDVDGDGHVDLFTTRFDDTDLLHLNQGDGTFSSTGSVLAGFTQDMQTNGAAFADIDNDGDLDLFVSTVRESRYLLYVNDGTGHFTEEAALRGADVDDGELNGGQSVAVGDYDGDGWLDLHICEWGSSQAHARILRNRGPSAPGYFDDETVDAGLDLSDVPGIPGGVFAFTSRFSDVDLDGHPDLLIASDFETTRLFWNDGDGTFTDGTIAAGVGTDENGMGAALGDVDGDGDLDWFVTSIWDPLDICNGGQFCNWGTSGNRLYLNEGLRSFSDGTDTYGVRDGRWGWGAAFFDYDNDGDLDLAMTNGQRFVGLGGLVGPYNFDPQRLFRNDGAGTVMPDVAASAGFAATTAGKGLLTFDYDDDGDLDVFVVANGEAPHLLRNDGGNDGAWLRVRVRTAGGVRDAIGARVEVEAQPGAVSMSREITGGPHFLAWSEPVAHFGLGDHAGSVHRVRVYAPGATLPWLVEHDVASGQTLVVDLPSAPPVPVGSGPILWGLLGATGVAAARPTRFGREPAAPIEAPSS